MSVGGSAADKSKSGVGSATTFFFDDFRLNPGDVASWSSAGSFAFLCLRNRFIMGGRVEALRGHLVIGKELMRFGNI